jgi:hypothetical protein
MTYTIAILAKSVMSGLHPSLSEHIISIEITCKPFKRGQVKKPKYTIQASILNISKNIAPIFDSFFIDRDLTNKNPQAVDQAQNSLTFRKNTQSSSSTEKAQLRNRQNGFKIVKLPDNMLSKGDLIFKPETYQMEANIHMGVVRVHLYRPHIEKEGN